MPRGEIRVLAEGAGIAPGVQNRFRATAVVV